MPILSIRNFVQWGMWNLDTFPMYKSPIQGRTGEYPVSCTKESVAWELFNNCQNK